MTILDLAETLSTGSIFGLRVGVGVDDAASILSQVDKVSRKMGGGGIQLLKLRSVELHFFNGRLFSGRIDLREPQSDEFLVTLWGDPVSASTSIVEVVEKLEANSVEWRCCSTQCSGKNIELVSVGGAALQFGVVDCRISLQQIRLAEDIIFADDDTPLDLR